MIALTEHFRHGALVGISVSLAIAMCVGTLDAQAESEGSPRIESSADIRVSADSSIVHIEPHLAVHPDDPDLLVAAAMTIQEQGEGFSIVVYRSEDGGHTWSSAALLSAEADAVAGGVDPWLAYGPDGILYLSKLPGEVWRSTDDGGTWSGPSTLPDGGSGGYDAPRIDVDRSGSTYEGRLYVSALQQSVTRSGGESDDAVAVLRSQDGAKTFGGPEHVVLSDVGVRHGDAVVLPSGVLLVTLHDLFHGGEPLDSPRLWSIRSTDGGRTFTTPSLITDRFLAISPLLAVDRSRGSHRGRAHAAWLGLGGDRNRYVAYTDDAGDTWSDPIRITAVTDSSRYPTYTSVAVSTDGTVGVMWAENVRSEGESCYEYRFAASVDGGETFTNPVTVSDTVACSDTEAHQVLMHDEGLRGATVFERFPQGGDYFGMVALPGGAFQAVWADARTGVFQLWTDRVTVKRP